MARKGLPKWIIKKYGISKQAWKVYKSGKTQKGNRGKTAGRSKSRVSSNPGPRRKGIVAKLNWGLRALRFGLPALGSLANSGGFTPGTPRSIVLRYTAYDIDSKELNTDVLKRNVGFYAGNVVEAKVMSALKIPQMAGKKKLISVIANFLPEISAIPQLVAGDYKGAMATIGTTGIGYEPMGHQSFITDAGVRDTWLKALGSRAVLGLMSRFIGPMVNKYLPKGVNI